VHDVADRELPLAVVDLMRDRGRFHAERLADQAGEVGERPAELSGVGVKDRLALIVRRALVDEHHLLPAPRRQDVSWDVDDAHEVQAAHVDATDRAAVEVVGIEGVACPAVGVLADPAGTQHSAGACLEQRAFELVDDLGRVSGRTHGIPFRSWVATRRSQAGATGAPHERKRWSEWSR